MKKEINHSEFGKIVYEESVWTGKRTITINGQKLLKVGKTNFKLTLENGESSYVSVIGNMFKGTFLKIMGKMVLVSPAVKWYEYVLGFLPLALVIVWGNSPALCEIVPVVGGAIGGAISGALSIVSIVLMKESKNVVTKVLIGLACLAVTFLICMGVGKAIVSLF